MNAMSWADKTISGPERCAARGLSSLPACKAKRGRFAARRSPNSPRRPTTPYRLVRPPDEIARLMAALALRLGFAMPPGAGTGLVRALAVLPDEVTLELAVRRACGGRGLIDTAFQTLRGLLPDTDIYVTYAD